MADEDKKELKEEELDKVSGGEEIKIDGKEVKSFDYNPFH